MVALEMDNAQEAAAENEDCWLSSPALWHRMGRHRGGHV
jgi:hypothetical protein